MELELDEVIENLEYLVSDSCTNTQLMSCEGRNCDEPYNSVRNQRRCRA